MNSDKSLTRQAVQLGDAAVDGLIQGLLAGGAMALYLIGVTLLAGGDVGVLLARFDAGEASSPLRGALLHLAVSGVYGMLFGLIDRGLRARIRLPGVWLGILYAAVLFVIAEAVLLPGAQSPLLAIPWVHFAVAHAIYGLTLGALSARVGRRLVGHDLGALHRW